MEKNQFFKSAFLLIVIIFLTTSNSYAGRLPEEWDTLPQIEIMRFSKDAVGFMASDHRFFILDRKSKSFLSCDESVYLRLFPESRNQKTAEILSDSGIGSAVLLRASDGSEYQTQNAYCSEGENIHHTLFYKGKAVVDNVAPCDSISAVEIIGDQLWLGTRRDGEYGGYPAAGLVVQSLKSAKLLKKLDAESGLTGNLIRAIRKDLFGGTIWIATEQGFNTVDQNFKIINRQYFYEDFDDQSGKSTVFLSPSRRNSNPLAVIQRQLNVDRPKEFYEAVKQIPHDALKGFSLRNVNIGIYSGLNTSNVEESFVPREMNILAPFFIESAESQNDSARRHAIVMLCMFNDRRVIDFFIDFEKRPSSDHLGQSVARDCIDKYGKLGLLKEDQSSLQIEELLNRERRALESIKSEPPDDLAPYNAVQSVVESAQSLKKLGSVQGFQLVNEYFLASDGSPRDGRLYDMVVQRLIYDDEILPAVLSGLKKLQTGLLYRGCSYLNMRYKPLLRSARYDAAYAEAILIGLEHATNPSGAMLRSGIAGLAVLECREAFKFQMQEATVKREFMRRFYPSLTPSQKAIADVLLKE